MSKLYTVDFNNYERVFFYVWIVLLCIVLLYAILKEREELGCHRISIARQCDDENSVYVKGTKMDVNDTYDDLHKKLISIVSYHEKAGVWRRCFILATLITFSSFLIYIFSCKYNISWFAIHIITFCILYFFFNFINFHHFRYLKNNGMEIIERMKNLK